MDKKVGFIFLSLLLVAGFVFATMEIATNNYYDVEIEIHEGWNIIAGIFPEEGLLDNSEIKLEDIEVVWYYSPFQKKYFEIYPNLDENELRNDDGDFILTSAMWIYSKKSGNLKYNTLGNYPSLNQRELITGWNFMTITPDMTIDINDATPEEEAQYTLNNLKGSCDFEKVYHFEESIQEWSQNLTNDPFMEEELGSNVAGHGILVKVSSNCNLGRLGGSGPPILPGDEL